MTQEEFRLLFPDFAKPGTIKPYLQKGDWAVHEILPVFLLNKKADIRIATYSISEDSLRPLFFLSKSEQIRSLKLLLDTTIKRHKLPLLLFAEGFVPIIGTDAVHAKILLVDVDKEHRFGIVGSANLNRNHRWESGFYFTAGEHYDYFEKMFDVALNQSIIE